METIKQAYFSGERAQYEVSGKNYVDCVFDNGESPLKESKNIQLQGTQFKWKYPLWYCSDVEVENCTWFEMARAGVWYSRNLKIRDCILQAPKNFRRCSHVELVNVNFSKAEETLWSCDDVKMKNVTARGDYFAMNSRNMDIDGLFLDGNYGFDGVENLTIRNSKLLTKDAFWNCRNVKVMDSFISGEYLAWNSENVEFVNCTIESLQGLCYVKNLKLTGCKLINTTLAFEYSDLDAEVMSKVDSILNPGPGSIKAPEIGELIVEKDRVPETASIDCSHVDKISARPEWIKE